MKISRLCSLLLFFSLFLSIVTMTGCNREPSEEIPPPETSTVPESEDSPPESEETLTPTPGHIVIGKISLPASGPSVDMDLLNRYVISSGATLEIKDYNSDKALMEAIRAGEIDVIFSNSLISHLLAYDDQLFDLDPYVKETLASGDYYNNILEAGRIHGKLQILVPEFGIGSCAIVPDGLVKEFGEAQNLPQLFELYTKLETEYRGIGGTRFWGDSEKILLDASLDLETMQFDLTPYWNDWVNLLGAISRDSVGIGLDYTSLFSFNGGGSFALDPMQLHDMFVMDDGTSYSKYGPHGVLLPISIREGEGYPINGELYCIPKNSPNPQAALHLLNWLVTEEGQTEIEYNRLGCPVLKSVAQKYIASFRSYPEYHYTLPEQISMAEAYIARADHLSISYELLSHTTDMLMGDRCWDQAERDRVIAMFTTTDPDDEYYYSEQNEILIECWAVMFDYLQLEEAPAEKMPWFYEEGSYTDWPDYIKGYVTAYLADLGYELH